MLHFFSIQPFLRCFFHPNFLKSPNDSTDFAQLERSNASTFCLCH